MKPMKPRQKTSPIRGGARRRPRARPYEFDPSYRGPTTSRSVATVANACVRQMG